MNYIKKIISPTELQCQLNYQNKIQFGIKKII
jgi:hypothetical protein